MKQLDELRVGFCGTRKMGMPMMQRLINTGRHVAIWNRSTEKTQALARNFAGHCFACKTPAEIAAHADIVLLCLADGRAVEDVVFGPNGLAEGAGSTSLTVVDHSTITPAQTRSLSTRWRRTTGEHGLTPQYLAALQGPAQAHWRFLLEGMRRLLKMYRQCSLRMEPTSLIWANRAQDRQRSLPIRLSS